MSDSFGVFQSRKWNLWLSIAAWMILAQCSRTIGLAADEIATPTAKKVEVAEDEVEPVTKKWNEIVAAAEVRDWERVVSMCQNGNTLADYTVMAGDRELRASAH